MFTEEEEKAIIDAVVEGFTKGQGEFTDQELAMARNDVLENMIKGETASMLMEGLLGIHVDDGIVKYKAVGDRPLP